MSDDLYFECDIAQRIIRLEEIFQKCDNTDRAVIFGLFRGESVEEIAEGVFLTPRAVRYRIKNFFNRYTAMSQNEFFSELNDILK